MLFTLYKSILAGILIANLIDSGILVKSLVAKEEQGNSQIEEELILEDYKNKINYYVTLDCRISDKDWIKAEIKKSILTIYFFILSHLFYR